MCGVVRGGGDGACRHKHTPLNLSICLHSRDHLHLPPVGTTSDRVEVEHYDPYNDTWSLTCPALKYVTNFTATACHGKLYVIGSCAVKYNALAMQCYNPVIGKDDTSKPNFYKGSAFFTQIYTGKGLCKFFNLQLAASTSC